MSNTSSIAGDIQLQAGTKTVSLAEIYQQAPTVFILLRHFGCPVCREHLLVTADIQADIEARGAQVVGVGQGFGEEAQIFAESIGIRFPVFGDPQNQLYKALSIPRGSLWQVTLGPLLRAPLTGLKRMRHVGKAGKDIYQLGGVAIIDTDGKIRYSYQQTDSGDMPDNHTILQQL